ncbi:MAG TPA: hypothetical protein PLT64_09450 [Syntrophales bacterium]|nr:hypothetical protein [Syntrophales bacterium]HOL60068.1 hypothetical protein [Syntrophales bacterium]HPO36178.1 hypothetical protein [Syntrophales bacterium]
MKRKAGLVAVLVIGGIVLFLACAPGPEMYHVSLKYDPGIGKAVGQVAGEKKVVVTMFRDVRSVDDPVKMGWVTHPGGKKLWVMPVKEYPDVAVTEVVSEYLRHQGYRVEAHHPLWDLKDETIDAGLGDILVGGTIEELEVTCDNADRFSPVKKYTARVRIKFVIADGKNRRVVFKTETEATSSLKDVSFSTEKLERQLNDALAEVMEKAFSGKEMVRILRNL